MFSDAVSLALKGPSPRRGGSQRGGNRTKQGREAGNSPEGEVSNMWRAHNAVKIRAAEDAGEVTRPPAAPSAALPGKTGLSWSVCLRLAACEEQPAPSGQ